MKVKGQWAQYGIALIFWSVAVDLSPQLTGTIYLHMHVTYSLVKGFRPHDLLVHRLCLPSDPPIIILGVVTGIKTFDHESCALIACFSKALILNHLP